MNKKIVVIFIIFILLIFAISVTNTYAGDLGDVISGGKSFVDSSKGDVEIDSSKLSQTSKSVYNILLMISFIVVAVVGIILGMKFMMAGVDEKAKAKESLVIFFIGCIVVYGAFGIWKVLVTALSSL